MEKLTHYAARTAASLDRTAELLQLTDIADALRKGCGNDGAGA